MLLEMAGAIPTAPIVKATRGAKKTAAKKTEPMRRAARTEAPKTAKAAREEMRRNLISGVVSDPLFKAARSAATPKRRRAARKKK
jgi:hypothetical protein